MQDYLSELIETAVEIVHLKRIEDQLSNKSEWRAAKQNYELLQERFNKIRKDFVDELLSVEGADGSTPNIVQARLAELREQADPSWLPAIDYTSENLQPYLDKEASRSPRMRKARKVAPYATAALIAVLYIGVRLFSGTPVTDGIETRNGLQQRAAAAEKAIRYDDWMDTHVRRGGWLKGLLLWPIEPNDLEVKGAAEFFGLVFEGQRYADRCGTVTNDGDTVTSEQIKMVSEVAEYIQREDIEWEEPAPATIVAALEHTTVC